MWNDLTKGDNANKYFNLHLLQEFLRFHQLTNKVRMHKRHSINLQKKYNVNTEIALKIHCFYLPKKCIGCEENYVLTK